MPANPSHTWSLSSLYTESLHSPPIKVAAPLLIHGIARDESIESIKGKLGKPVREYSYPRCSPGVRLRYGADGNEPYIHFSNFRRAPIGYIHGTVLTSKDTILAKQGAPRSQVRLYLGKPYLSHHVGSSQVNSHFIETSPYVDEYYPEYSLGIRYLGDRVALVWMEGSIDEQYIPPPGRRHRWPQPESL